MFITLLIIINILKATITKPIDIMMSVGVYLMTQFRCQLCVPAIIGIAVDTGSEGMTVT